MEGWVRVCGSEELLPGEFRLAYDGDTAIAVFNIDGELYAIEDVCTHDGGELAGGPVEGYEIECLRHGARFDLRTARRCRRRLTPRPPYSRSSGRTARSGRGTTADSERGSPQGTS
jgi:3-phenylpropionate/trans-cinnamate dioxygenase ferredoxin subunit